MSDLVSKNKLRDFAEQVNGIRPTERSLRGVVDNLINNYKGGSGSKVIANPELVGDEDDLNGLEVDGVKYKVPSGSGGGSVLLELTDELPEYIPVGDNTVEVFELTTDTTDLPNKKIHISQESLSVLLNIDYTKCLCVKFSNREECYFLKQFSTSLEESYVDYEFNNVGLTASDIYDQSMILTIIKGVGIELTIKNLSRFNSNQ